MTAGRRHQRGGAAPLLLATCATVVVLALFLGLVDLVGATAVREHAQGALVTSVRAASRQIDRPAWVYDHHVDLRDAEPVFRRLIAANLELDAGGYPLRPGSLMEGPVQARLEVRGATATGYLTIPVRTRFLGHRARLRLSYSAQVQILSE